MTPDAARELWVVRLGRMAYAEALELQRAVARARISGAVPQDVLLLVEHDPVVTMGRTAKQQNLTTSPELLAARGVELFEVERGGDVTYHGPGQLVGYPIVDLKRHRQDLHWYLRQVEEALIVAIGARGIAGERSEGYTGVWTRGLVDAASHPPRKVASIGVHARDWVTWHGFALNVTTELSYFGLIVPCGIAGVDMTSMSRELGAPVEMRDVERDVAAAFGRVFSLEPRDVSADALQLDAPAPA
ncbi:MAG: lipoyl(octanoyl) transferase LipB [Gemmatimonadaceae bacterium]|nr:lipoyl(octanoyl) transferase LipB [Gemmatimonadaceae bacterium]NUQ93952.1 lipoyl(octanoyl) transferase LipB [Gemmatimonadaceae bacterium]NUR20787.1 lipoyl(octanoyl) transferase LipB [Gemmatimonadaceae bacterium]NUS95907.1 lipoyl(octanoyl) transferase LipB [Gemmatimonadaceae bacterium]